MQCLKIPLATRITGLEKVAKKSIEEKVAALMRQDKRLAQKASARLLAQLQKTTEFLHGLPPQKYDRRTEERITVVQMLPMAPRG